MQSTQIVSNYTPPTLFDLQTGKITPRFQKQLNICGIKLHAHFPHLPADHIKNVDKELQTNGCFQKDYEVYKNGGSSKLQLTEKQAVAFLEDDYSDRVQIMPKVSHKNIPADAIVGCGVEPTMHKRFDTIAKAIANGYTFAAIHFIVKDESFREMIEKLIKEQYSEVIKGMPINFIIANVETDVHQAGLNQLQKQNGLITNNYIMVTDIMLAPKVELFAKSILNNKNFLGIAASAVTDYKKDMNIYGYQKAFKGNVTKAIIAFVCSAWNFKAREVHSELAIYEANKREKRKQAAVLAGIAVGCLALLTKMALNK